MTVVRAVKLDLGVADVHQPGALVASRKRNPMATPPKIKTAPKAKKAASTSKRGRRLHVRADLAAGGSLHVRQMSDVGVQLDGATCLLADDDAKPVWIQLAKPGLFKGHPAGPFELSESTFGEIVRNFKATPGQEIPIDYEHASESDSTSGTIPIHGAPAQGWIVDMKIEGGNLWGLVNWGAQAREQIRSGQYKYFSPAVRFKSKDRVTGAPIGARMTSGALTNNPFLSSMRPLAAKDAAPGPSTGEPVTAMRLAFSPAEYMPRLRCILGLSELSTAAECAEQLERLHEHFDAAGEDPDGSHEGIALARFVYPLRGLVNASLSDTWDDVFDCAASLIAGASGAVEEDVEEIPPPAPSSSSAAGVADMDDDEGGADMTDDVATALTTLKSAIGLAFTITQSRKP